MSKVLIIELAGVRAAIVGATEFVFAIRGGPRCAALLTGIGTALWTAVAWVPGWHALTVLFAVLTALFTAFIVLGSRQK